MKMTTGTIHGVRAVVLWVVRLIGAVMVAWGAYLMTRWMLYGLLWNLPDVWSGVQEGLPRIAIGGVLCVGGRWLARWMVPVPETGCPACGYETLPGVCPECGYVEIAATGSSEGSTNRSGHVISPGG
jgi:hypothetical protein